DEEVDASSDQLIGQVRDPLVPFAILSILGDEATTVDPAELLHSLVKGPPVGKRWRGRGKQEPNPVDLVRLLPSNAGRGGEHPAREQSQECAAVHPAASGRSGR